MSMNAFHQINCEMDNNIEDLSFIIARRKHFFFSYMMNKRDKANKFQRKLVMIPNRILVSHFLITVVANPNWSEVIYALSGANYCRKLRDTVIARVFHRKLKVLINQIKEHGILGFNADVCYFIELQKRALPRGHILVNIYLDIIPEIKNQSLHDGYPTQLMTSNDSVPMSLLSLQYSTSDLCNLNHEFVMEKTKCRIHFPKFTGISIKVDSNELPMRRRLDSNEYVYRFAWKNYLRIDRILSSHTFPTSIKCTRFVGIIRYLFRNVESFPDYNIIVKKNMMKFRLRK